MMSHTLASSRSLYLNLKNHVFAIKSSAQERDEYESKLSSTQNECEMWDERGSWSEKATKAPTRPSAVELRRVLKSQVCDLRFDDDKEKKKYNRSAHRTTQKKVNKRLRQRNGIFALELFETRPYGNAHRLMSDKKPFFNEISTEKFIELADSTYVSINDMWVWKYSNYRPCKNYLQEF